MRESAVKINDNAPFYQQRKVFLETILKKTSHKNLAEILLKHLSLSDHELEKVTIESFSELIDEAWKLIQKFSGGTHKLHLFEQITKYHEHTALVILNKDMPFLVDSVTNLLRTQGYVIDTLIHPVIDTVRTKEGKLTKLTFANPNEDKQLRESLIIVQLEEKLNTSDKSHLKKSLSHVLSDNFYAVHDWQTIRTEISHIINELKTPPFHFPKDENNEIQDFLHWLDNGHFTFLGFREYSFTDPNKVTVVKSLGTLRNIKSCLYRLDCATNNVEDFLHSKKNFTITKTIARATVHRNTPMDVIRLKKFNAQKEVIGEYEFIGLFTSAVYNESIKHFPILRRKIANVIRASGLSSSWHDGKTLLHILETFPREELFQIEEKDLIKACEHVLELQERQKVTVLLREDPLGHLITCLIYVPKERYNAALRNRMGYILETEMDAQITSQAPTLDPDLPYARVYYTLAKDYTQKASFHRPTLQRILTAASLTWKDHFHAHLIQHYSADSITPLKRKFLHAFPVYYQEQFTPEVAVHDIEFVQEVLKTQKLLVRIYEKKHIDHTTYNLRLFHPTTPVPLSDILPILENMGLKVITELNYRITEQETKGVVYLHDFIVDLHSPFEGAFSTRKEEFEEGLVQIWNGHVENDGFNSLTLAASLSWEHIIILRAYCKYLKQTEFTFAQSFIEQCMIRNASLAQKLIDLFFLFFAPDKKTIPDTTINDFLAEIEQNIDQVEKSEDDRVLKQFLTLISATLRTNYFQRTPTGNLKSYLIFKFNCHLIPNLPRPYPALEFFVYAPNFEAVHLRTGAVARGGLRWSDRQEDFRKEILGLMKAQKVKNSVIVPVGAKGGFVLKGDLSHLTHSEYQSAGIKAYETFIQSMLDLTDNRVNNKTVHPKKVRRYDGKDSYLVVAADKGTATFSDIANKISEKNRYWLQDAFASGGSQGYDHKKMGITARGAWVCVTRHFREMNIDIQTSPFTVAGIGDMSGDVFGNGMLLSEQIRLIGAFNHLHIFIDPNPDPLVSYKERKRLFEMPYSTWADYNPALISKGGAVYKRTDKKIKISSEAKSVLKLQRRELTPDELIQAILMAPVQLLWFGGIGTYVKSSLESNQEVGDRTNDHLRVGAAMLRCKVIGEGANLGITQKGRIEYALAGGRINTDAIDNSAGVDCSDHEVNIKILLDNVVAHHKLSYEKRNKLLFDMTDNVAHLVLRNNFLQSLAISMIQARGYRLLERQNRLIKHLEKAGLLDPQLADLPFAWRHERRNREIHCQLQGTIFQIYSLFAHVHFWQ